MLYPFKYIVALSFFGNLSLFALYEFLGFLVEFVFAVCYSVDLFAVRLSEELYNVILLTAKTEAGCLRTNYSERMRTGQDAISCRAMIVFACVDFHCFAFLNGVSFISIANDLLIGILQMRIESSCRCKQLL
jgi:hypothetical protein